MVSVKRDNMTGTRLSALIAVFGCLVTSGACRNNSEAATREYLKSGDGYAAQGKYEEAVIEYRNAVQQDPKSGEAHLKLAQAYEHLGDLKNATGEYVRAADLLPSNTAVQVQAANLLLTARQFEDAKARAEMGLVASPENVEAQIAKGNALAGLKNLDAAVAEIEAAIREDPGRIASYANLAALELARGNRSEAEAAFKRATETHPTSVPARLALANFYWSTNRIPAAERELKAAVDASPKDASANRAFAVFYLATNRAPAAEKYLKTVRDVSGQSRDGLLLADYYFYTGRFAESKALLEDLAKIDAQTFSSATVRLAGIAARDGDKPSARKLLDEVLAKEPRSVDALVASANLYRSETKYDQALAQAVAAQQMDPRSVSAQYAVASIHSANQNWDDALAAYGRVLELNPRVNAARLELARLSLAKGQLDDAIRYAQEALKVQSDLHEGKLILARAMLRKGNPAAAEPHVVQLANQFPTSASAQSGLGQLHALKGDTNKARAAFDRALTIEPNNIEALTGLTILDIQSRNPAAARARIDSRMAGNQENPSFLLLAARAYTAVGDLAATERTLRRVIEVDAAQLEAYALLGQFYASQNRLDEARAEFERVAQVRPKNAVGAHTVVGMILQMQNKPAEAQARYEKVLSLDPRAAVAANNLAWIYAEGDGNLDVALGLAQTAKAQLPDSPDVSDTLGWVYYKKNLPALALPLFLQCVERWPGVALYQYHLGLAQAKSGNKDDARKALGQALALDPKFDGADDAQRVLAGLKG